jgi:hypothetical protein
VSTLAFQTTSSLNHLLNNEHDLNFDQRDDDVKNQHGSNNGSNNNNNVPSTEDDDDCTAAARNDGALISNDIVE